MHTDTGLTGEVRSSWVWWATGLVAIVAFGCGFVGMWEYEQAVRPGGSVDPWSVTYHTLQLFILHAPHLDGPIPWSLHVGRLLGAIPVCVAALIGFFKVFPDELNLLRLRLPWARGHVVICGLGEVGVQLAIQGRRRKKRMVAIESQCPQATRQLMRQHGVLVLDGDATEESQLEGARIQRAEFVVASCHDDQTNIALAAAIGKLAESARGRHNALICRTLIENPDTRRLLSSASFSSDDSRYRVNFTDLDQHAVAARQALRMYPLDFQPIRQHDDNLVRLIVVGFGMAGQSLALHAAQIGHFANEVGKGRRLLLSIADPTDSLLNEFKTRYPNLERVCDVELIVLPLSASDQVNKLAELCPDGEPAGSLVTYAFCCDDELGDERNFRLGTELHEKVRCRAAQILIRQTSRKGFSAVLSGGRIYPFGMIEDVFGWDVLLHESEDKLARALHKVYKLKNPSEPHPEWDELGEGYRDSNRQAADHTSIKLRALGYHAEQLTKEKPRIVSFADSEIELLAQMEHIRWCAERYLAGWMYGEQTDRQRKINRNLVAWDKLLPTEQKKDPEQINTISEALYSIGLGIYR